MKINENIAISTPEVLLVPYDSRHVPRYHEWMQDPALREATASEPLTLAEEYENQASWRAAHDKLTFILCQPLSAPPTTTTTTTTTTEAAAAAAATALAAGEADAPARMVGDINLFLSTPAPPSPRLSPSFSSQADAAAAAAVVVVGEVDVMITAARDRGRGLGRAAVAALVRWVAARRAAVLGEYHAGGGGGGGGTAAALLLMAKIKAGNRASVALFRRLGFVQKGGVDYFGEVRMVLGPLEEGQGPAEGKGPGYRVVEYCRAVG